MDYAWRRYGPYSSADLKNGFMIMVGDLNPESDYGYIDAVLLTQDVDYRPGNILPFPNPSVFEWIPQAEDEGTKSYPVRVFLNDELIYDGEYVVNVLPPRTKAVRITGFTYEYLGTPPTGDGSHGGAEGAGPHAFGEGALTDGDFNTPGAVQQERWGSSARWTRGVENNQPILFDLQQEYPLDKIQLVSHAPHTLERISKAGSSGENGDLGQRGGTHGSPMPVTIGWCS